MPSGRMTAGLPGGEEEERDVEVARMEKRLDQYTLSLEHTLTHKPKLPYCRICIHAKMQERPHKRGAFRRELAAWGDLLTADHITATSRDMLGVHGQPQAFTILDVWTRMKAIYPLPDKTTESPAMAIRDFTGGVFVKQLYSDGADEIVSACRAEGILPDTSQPGHPENNALIERTNQDIIHGTRTLLFQAGLPSCFWTFAAPCYCLLDNATDKKETKSAWELKYGSPFEGALLPFGCLVSYLPSPTKGLEGSVAKMDPSAREGVFAGYKMKPGYGWSGEYLVWDLRDFMGVTLQRDEGFKNIGFHSPHVSSRVALFANKLHFPLKERYDRVNSTIEGVDPVHCGRGERDST